jgi:hypothetical protein
MRKIVFISSTSADVGVIPPTGEAVASWSAEAAAFLDGYTGPHDFAVDWLLGGLSEATKDAVRRGARESQWHRLLEELDRPGAAEEFRDLLDLAQCLVPGAVAEPELGAWAAASAARPPATFWPRLCAWLARHGLQHDEQAQAETAALWVRLAGASACSDFFRLRDCLERLRKPCDQPASVAVRCALHDYPELIEPDPKGERCSLSLREFLLRRLRAWCRQRCRPAAPGDRLPVLLAAWSAADGATLLNLLGYGPPPPLPAEEPPLAPGPPAPILVVGPAPATFGEGWADAGRPGPALDPAAYRDVCKLVRATRTPVNNDVRPFDRPEDIQAPGLLRAAGPCVVAVPGPRGDAPNLLGQLRERLDRPRVIVVLAEDAPALAWDLLFQGAYDVVWRWGSVAHLRHSIENAANGARQCPYAAIFPDTRDYDPKPDAPWSVAVCPEELSSATSVRDYGVLRALSRCFRLPPEAVAFREVLPVLPGAGGVEPHLVLALLSTEPSDRQRADFFAAMRSLEANGCRVVFLLRFGAALAPDLALDHRPGLRRVVRYSSAIELLLRLYFGFGGVIPEPERFPKESMSHDQIPLTGW